jgi:hypothetical protein
VVDCVADDEAVLELGTPDLNATGFVVVDVVLPDHNLPGFESSNQRFCSFLPVESIQFWGNPSPSPTPTPKHVEET